MARRFELFNSISSVTAVVGFFISDVVTWLLGESVWRMGEVECESDKSGQSWFKLLSCFHNFTGDVCNEDGSECALKVCEKFVFQRFLDGNCYGRSGKLRQLLRKLYNQRCH